MFLSNIWTALFKKETWKAKHQLQSIFIKKIVFVSLDFFLRFLSSNEFDRFGENTCFTQHYLSGKFIIMPVAGLFCEASERIKTVYNVCGLACFFRLGPNGNTLCWFVLTSFSIVNVFTRRNGCGAGASQDWRQKESLRNMFLFDSFFSWVLTSSFSFLFNTNFWRKCVCNKTQHR